MLNLFELTLRLNGYPISEAKKRLRKIQNINETEYGAYVQHQRQEIVKYHLENNPFYKSFIGITTTDNWKDIPIMQKKDLPFSFDFPVDRSLNKALIERDDFGFDGNAILSILGVDLLERGELRASLPGRLAQRALT